MKRLAMFLLGVFLAAGVVGGSGVARAAAKPKGKPAAGKVAVAPTASVAEVNKLKGEFKWGMTLDEVADEIAKRVETSYTEKLAKTANDPTRQDRVRKEMRAEIDKIKKNYTKFDGDKTGYDVSIIDQEFSRGTSESMLMTKEDNATRYFFFAFDHLYKMYVAFDKEMLQGKSFGEFGGLMQKRFGKAREVFAEGMTKQGPKKKLDHFVWSSKSGDALRLVDRSEFYDVYCLVIYDSAKDAELADARKANMKVGPKGDSLVEAVTSAPLNDRDPNDNVLDRITGKTIRKPGDNANSADIVVPMPAKPPAP